MSLVNVIIGKNNSGKSNIIEIANVAFKEKLVVDRPSESFPIISIVFSNQYSELMEARADRPDLRCKRLSEPNYRKYSVDCVFERIGKSRTINRKPSWIQKWIVTDSNGQTRSVTGPPVMKISCPGVDDADRDVLEKAVAETKRWFIENCLCLHMQADRTIVPEVKTQHPEYEWVKSIHSNGAGLTDFLRHILICKTDAADRYKNILKDGMNKILSPEIEIEEIRTIPQDEGDTFEIQVKEKGKPMYKLSTLGSGIKTVFQLIMMTEVVPEFLQRTNPPKTEPPHPMKSRLVFTLEELENNLHPAAQRRMYHYILDYAREHSALFFISTHSSVCLNYLFGKNEVSVYSVTQKHGASKIERVSEPQGIRGVMDDIGANPSDIMQSNGIVWVEGPSDRIYIRKWLELAGFTDCEEGLDYQFQFYGGSILSHYSAENQTGEADPRIEMLKINRHSALVMDSDITEENKSINDTKQRILDEFKNSKSAKLFAWCTDGKEIENYLRPADVEGAYPGWENYVIERYQPFSTFNKSSDRKVDFALKVTPLMTDESLDQLDLRERINQLGNMIRSWKGD